MIKEPTWTWEIPVYFFTGGLGGASSTLGLAAKLFGNEKLSRTALYIGAAADAVSAPLLISDLGRPERFHHMLRVVQGDLADEHRRLDPHRGRRRVEHRGRARAARHPAAGQLRRGARRRSLRPAARDVHRRAARRHRGSRLARGTARAAVDLRCERVGFRGRSRVPLPRPGRRGPGAAAGGRQRDRGVGADARRWSTASARSARSTATAQRAGSARAAKGLHRAGATLLATARQAAAAAPSLGGALVCAGGMCLRWSVYKAGFQSARDPKYTVGRSASERGATARRRRRSPAKPQAHRPAGPDRRERDRSETARARPGPGPVVGLSRLPHAAARTSSRRVGTKTYRGLARVWP